MFAYYFFEYFNFLIEMFRSVRDIIMSKINVTFFYRVEWSARNFPALEGVLGTL